METYYEILTGPFAGDVVLEGTKLLTNWADLDEDMRAEALAWAEEHGESVREDDLLELWECSWDQIEVAHHPNL